MRTALLTGLLFLGTVSANPARALSMHDKAELFQLDMESRFLLDGQALCKLKLPVGNREFVAYNMPDNAYMTGIYTGTLAMKYAVTGAPRDLEAARNSLAALHLLCNVSGVPGVLARAAWPKDKPMDDDGIWRESACGKYLWRGDVSTDQVAGVMYGFSLAHDLIATEEEKADIARDVIAMVNLVLNNDMRIVDVDGKPTRWGRYDPRYVSRTEQMNALLWLQALKVAEQVSGETRYAELYRTWAVDEGYAELSVSARRKALPAFRGMVNHSDDVLIFLAYASLLRHETDPVLRGQVLTSLRRSWEGEGRFPGVKYEHNPFYAFIAAKYLADDTAAPGGVDTLRWFPLDMKWNKDTLSRYEELRGFAYDPAPKSPMPEAGLPLPVDRRSKTWSAWVQDPYHSAGERDADEPIEYNGHDYLLGYWTGRYHDFIGENE